MLAEQNWDGHAEELWAMRNNPDWCIAPIELKTIFDAIEIFVETKQPKILDAGCGIGKYTKHFIHLGYENIYCIEQNDKMLDYLRQRIPSLPEDHIQKGVLYEELITDGPWKDFDVIWTSAVLQHNNQEQKRKILNNFLKMSKKDTVFLFLEDTPDNENANYNLSKSNWKLFFSDYFNEIIILKKDFIESGRRLYICWRKKDGK